jgi:hypothetical protein
LNSRPFSGNARGEYVDQVGTERQDDLAAQADNGGEAEAQADGDELDEV